MNKSDSKISKFLSLVLRHESERIGINLDQNGWTDIEILIHQSNLHGIPLDRQILDRIVETSDKKRFKINESMDKIRANQGHSVDIELGLKTQKPPQKLYHGTSEKSVQSILNSGLDKRTRQHVHLSSDLETAKLVGQRHGKPVIFEVLSEEMYNDKFEFHCSDNGVWLTDHVPTKYLKKRTE